MYMEIMLLTQLIGAAVLACFIAYESTVVQKLKSYLGLADYQKLPKFKPVFRPIGWLIEELKALLNCPYCLSFWLGLTITLQYYELWQAILYACLTIIIVHAYRKFTL